MTQMSRSRVPEKMNRTCILYHWESGAISHIQHVIVFEGGHEPTQEEIEAIARRSLEKRGLAHVDLRALHVAGDELKPFKAYRVDTAQKALVETERGPTSTGVA